MVVALALSIRVIGGSIGYAIYHNHFYNKLIKALPLDIASYVIEAGLPVASATDFMTLHLSDPAKLIIVEGVMPLVLEGVAVGSRWAYSTVLEYVLYTSIAFVVCAMLGLVKKHYTDHIAAKIER